MASTTELSQELCTCVWDGFNDGSELTVAQYETFYEHFYQNEAVDLSSVFTRRADYSLCTVAIVHFNSQTSHKESTRNWMARNFLNAVLPYKPDTVAADFNNLCSRVTQKGGDVRPRDNLLTLYLEEMLREKTQTPLSGRKSVVIASTIQARRDWLMLTGSQRSSAKELQVLTAGAYTCWIGGK